MTDQDYIEVKIRRELYEKIFAWVEASEAFETVETYIDFVLSEMLAGDEEELPEEEQAQLKKRLEDLGYL